MDLVELVGLEPDVVEVLLDNQVVLAPDLEVLDEVVELQEVLAEEDHQEEVLVVQDFLDAL